MPPQWQVAGSVSPWAVLADESEDLGSADQLLGNKSDTIGPSLQRGKTLSFKRGIQGLTPPSPVSPTQIWPSHSTMPSVLFKSPVATSHFPPRLSLRNMKAPHVVQKYLVTNSDD